MPRVLVALLALALVVTACGGEPEPEPTPEPTRTTSSPSPEPEPVVAPLTGLPVDDKSVLERPVLAVKIDNAGPARPQLGLEAADVVFEEVVEGGSTRFVALFQSTDPGQAGPVRSGREVDAQLLPAFQPLFVISGAAEPTYVVLRGSGMPIHEEGQPPAAFQRDGSRNRPYNLFVDVGQMWTVADEAGVPAATEAWPIAEEYGGGSAATGVTMSFSPSLPVRWTWDDGDGRWLREQSGAPHVTADDDQLGAENIVVLKVPVTQGGGVDVAGSPTHDIAVTGEGEAIVLRDGRAITGRWRKQSGDTQFSFVTDTGSVLPLAPGRTWVELLPASAAVEIQRPATPSPTGASPAPTSGSTGG